MTVKVSYEVEITERWCEITSAGCVRAYSGECLRAFVADNVEQSKSWCELVWLNNTLTIWTKQENGGLTSDRVLRTIAAGIPSHQELAAWVQASKRERERRNSQRRQRGRKENGSV